MSTIQFAPRHRPLVPLLAVALASGCALQSAEEEVVKTVAVKPGTVIRIKTHNGRIDVRPGVAGKVRIRALKKARATSNPRSLLKKIEVIIQPGPQGLRIEAKHPSGSISKQYGVTFHVRVPPDSKVLTETHNGSIHLQGIRGELRAETHNGSIKALEVTRPVTLETHNGSVRLEGDPGHFSVVTKNGSIKIRLSGTGRIAASSTAKTHNGSIRLWAPPTLTAAIQATTHNGSIRSDFSLETQSRRAASGTVGKGGASLSLRTHNGSIRILKQ